MDDAEVHPALEQVGGKAVAQQVDPAPWLRMPTRFLAFANTLLTVVSLIATVFAPVIKEYALPVLLGWF